MRAPEIAPPPTAAIAHEAYFRIHKHLVGPATAERLSFLYEALSQEQSPRMLYEAGWAAAEAAMVGTELSHTDRSHMVTAAKDCWEHSMQFEIERAADSAYRKRTTPDRSNELRMAMALASLPLISGIVEGRPSKEQRRVAYVSMVDVADEAAHALMEAHEHNMGGRVGAYKGVTHEANSALFINRLLSGRILAMPSLARADSGRYYPHQTHDIQVLQMQGDVIQHTVPLEAKSRLRGKFLDRYEAAIISSNQHLDAKSPVDVADQTALLVAERFGRAKPADTATLDQMTEAVIHVMRHHKRPEDYGRHCVNVSRCSIPKQRRVA